MVTHVVGATLALFAFLGVLISQLIFYILPNASLSLWLTFCFFLYSIIFSSISFGNLILTFIFALHSKSLYLTSTLPFINTALAASWMVFCVLMEVRFTSIPFVNSINRVANFINHCLSKGMCSLSRSSAFFLLYPLFLLYSIFAELCVVSPILILLSFELIFPGCFNPKMPTQDDTLIILVHGAGINQAQWVGVRYFLNCFYGIENLFSNNYYHGNFLKIKPRNKDEGIESFATETAEFINEILKSGSFKRLYLIGHSMGGLVSFNMAIRNLLHKPVDRIICIASPLWGSWILSKARHYLGWKKSLRQHEEMNPGSSFLTSLHSESRNLDCSIRLLTGYFDAMVRPDSALLTKTPRKVNCDGKVLLPHMGHYYPAASRSVACVLAKWIQEELKE